MKKLFFAVTFVVILLLAKNCPEKQVHSDHLTATLTSYLDERLNENEGIHKFALNVGTTLGGLVIDKVVDRKMTLTNFLLFSVAYVKWEEKNIPVSIGVFNHIFPLNEEEVREAVSQLGNF